MERLFTRVDEASKVMAEYNKRLEKELKERQEIQELLDVFIWQQKGLLREAKKNLKVTHCLMTLETCFYWAINLHLFFL